MTEEANPFQPRSTAGFEKINFNSRRVSLENGLSTAPTNALKLFRDVKARITDTFDKRTLSINPVSNGNTSGKGSPKRLSSDQSLIVEDNRTEMTRRMSVFKTQIPNIKDLFKRRYTHDSRPPTFLSNRKTEASSKNGPIEIVLGKKNSPVFTLGSIPEIKPSESKTTNIYLKKCNINMEGSRNSFLMSNSNTSKKISLKIDTSVAESPLRLDGIRKSSRPIQSFVSSLTEPKVSLSSKLNSILMRNSTRNQ